MLVRSLRAWAAIASIAAALVILLSPRAASAYPWMIRHEYTGCAVCHADPSGSGLLTEYGRGQSENLLRTRYGAKPSEEVSPAAGFLWGAVKLPEWLLLGGSFRDAILVSKIQGSPVSVRPLEMQTDLKAQVTASRFRASGSLGYMHEGALPTSITWRANDNLVSRTHWIGLDLGEDKPFLLRAGRIDLPFGLRIPEHTTFVRSVTRTDYNESQQHGVALSYSGEKVRGEIMGIAGNYQINPDAFRERGYSGFIEFPVAAKATIGASSLLTYAGKDRQAGVENAVRQAHGAFTRWAPAGPLVIMAEVDATLLSGKDAGTTPGMVSLLQADVEPVQGLHLIATGEAMATKGVGASFAGWATVNWFFLPHMDFRLDFVGASYAAASGSVTGITLLSQIHIFL